MPLQRAGKRSFHMSKKFALHQAGRYRAAIHFHQRTFLALAPIVNRPRDQFFSRTGFAIDQYRRIGGRHLLHFTQHRQQRRAVSGDFFEVVVRAYLFPQIHILFLQPRFQFANFFVRPHIGHGQRHLIRHILQQLHVGFAVLVFFRAPDSQRTNTLPSHDQRHDAVGDDADLD